MLRAVPTGTLAESASYESSPRLPRPNSKELEEARENNGKRPEGPLSEFRKDGVSFQPYPASDRRSAEYRQRGMIAGTLYLPGGIKVEATQEVTSEGHTVYKPTGRNSNFPISDKFTLQVDPQGNPVFFVQEGPLQGTRCVLRDGQFHFEDIRTDFGSAAIRYDDKSRCLSIEIKEGPFKGTKLEFNRERGRFESALLTTTMGDARIVFNGRSGNSIPDTPGKKLKDPPLSAPHSLFSQTMTLEIVNGPCEGTKMSYDQSSGSWSGELSIGGAQSRVSLEFDEKTGQWGANGALTVDGVHYTVKYKRLPGNAGKDSLEVTIANPNDPQKRGMSLTVQEGRISSMELRTGTRQIPIHLKYGTVLHEPHQESGGGATDELAMSTDTLNNVARALAGSVDSPSQKGSQASPLFWTISSMLRSQEEVTEIQLNVSPQGRFHSATVALQSGPHQYRFGYNARDKQFEMDVLVPIVDSSGRTSLISLSYDPQSSTGTEWSGKYTTPAGMEYEIRAGSNGIVVGVRDQSGAFEALVHHDATGQTHYSGRVKSGNFQLGFTLGPRGRQTLDLLFSTTFNRREFGEDRETSDNPGRH